MAGARGLAHALVTAAKEVCVGEHWLAMLALGTKEHFFSQGFLSWWGCTELHEPRLLLV